MAQPVLDRVTGEGAPWGAAVNDNDKQWDRVLVLPGRRGQSAEQNEMQSILEYYNRLHAEVFFKEGDVVSGAQLIVEGTAVQISAGRIFVAGKIREVPGTTSALTITGVGDETVGVKYTKTTVDEAGDPDLLDPAEGWLNFSQPGAHRRKYTFQWVVNDSTALTIFTIRNGSPQRTPLAPEASNYQKTLARRTFNESGHYLVRRITSAIARVDDNNVYLSIPQFMAYVQGYEIQRLAGFEVQIPISRDTDSVNDEQKTYSASTGLYTLNAAPVASVSLVTATVEVTQSIIRGQVVNTADLLPLTPVVSVVEVKQGTTTYLPTVDYIVVGDNIDWSPGGAEPGVGTTYDVKWRYTKTMQLATRTLTLVSAESRVKASGDDDALVNADGAEIVAIDDTSGGLDNPTHPYALDVDYQLRATPTGSEVHWLTATRPATSATFYVRYKYWAHAVEGDYAARNSYSDKWHKSVVTGLPPVGGGSLVPRRDEIDFRPTGTNPVDTTTFNVSYTFYLSKWYVTILDYNGDISLVPGEPARADAQVPTVPENLLPLERIFAPADSTSMVVVEYGIVAVTMAKLNQLIRRVERSEYNIAQEDLDNEAADREQATSKIGIFTDAFIGRTKMDLTSSGFAVAINPRKKELILPRNYQFPSPIGVDTANTNAELWETVATIPHTEYLVAEQPFKTDERNVNDALQIKRPIAKISIEPHEDLWVDYDVTSEVLAVQDHTLWLNQQTHVIQGVTDQGGGITTIDPAELNMILQSITAASEVTGRTVPAEFVRVRTVRVKGEHFAGLENVAIYFDGRRVDPTPIIGTAGDYQYSIKTTAAGIFEADFTIPSSVPAGVKFVSAIGESGQEDHAVYGAYGSNRTFAITTRIGLPLLQFNNAVVTHELPPPELPPPSVIVINNPPPVIPQTHVWDEGFIWNAGCDDPVAETIDFSVDRVIKGVDLVFSAKPADGNALVSCRFVEIGSSGSFGSGASGLPIRWSGVKQLGVMIKKASEITAEQYVRFNFPDPILVHAGREYGIMVYSPVAGFKVRVAQHGKFDISDPTKLVGLNPFVNGVFIYSTNGRTWDSEQDVDLTFRLWGCRFPTGAKYYLYFDPVSFGAIHRLTLQAAQEVPAQALVEWKYAGTGSYTPASLGLENKLVAALDSVRIQAVLQTQDANASPVIDFTSLFVEGITNVSPGRYVSKTITFAEDFSDATLWLQADRLGAPTTWTLYVWEEGSVNNWVLLTPASTRIISGEFEEHRYAFAPAVPQDTMKIRIDYSTTDLLTEPRARALMSVVF